MTEQNIFAIGIGDQFGIDAERLYILYAPLNGSISLASPSDIKALERLVAEGTGDERTTNALAAFQAKGKVPVHHMPKSCDELYQVDLLLNYTCNFKCVYCYSAAGRSNKQIEFEKVKVLIDYLFRPGIRQVNPYIINFSGGGEPLTSFPLIKQTVGYIKEKAEGTGYRYSLGLVTNGSLITPEIVDFFKSNNVEMAVSFEILKELQDSERGSYDRVAENLDMMVKKGYSFGIRTTFTPESVGRMEEMIEELHLRFPEIKSVVFDTVLAPSLFTTADDLDNYYNEFLDGFKKAKALALSYGINLQSIAAETLSIIRDRTCQGKLVLTPTGKISTCARVSSPKEEEYSHYIVGESSEVGYKADDSKLQAMLNECNIYSQSKCLDCYARWNCGGGCRLFNQSFSDDFQDARCRFMRKGLKLQLLEILSANYLKATSKDLSLMINEKISNGDL